MTKKTKVVRFEHRLEVAEVDPATIEKLETLSSLLQWCESKRATAKSDEVQDLISEVAHWAMKRIEKT